MWEHCGVVRSEGGLTDGLRELGEIREAAAVVDVRPGAEGWSDLAHALDLRAGLTVAEATLRCALERQESRGAQQRVDFPELDPELAVNLHVDGRLEPSREPVPPVPAELRSWLDRPVEPSADRLLE